MDNLIYSKSDALAQRLTELHERCNEQQLQINRLRETVDMLTKELRDTRAHSLADLVDDIEVAAGEANNHLWGVD